MTPKEAEELVRERWKRVYGGRDIAVTIYTGDKALHFLDYISAAEFTLQREEEIRQKQMERNRVSNLVEHGRRILLRQISYTHYEAFVRDMAVDLCRDCRILATLEAQLAALLVGWKETP